jgi:hypothetical protein
VWTPSSGSCCSPRRRNSGSGRNRRPWQHPRAARDPHEQVLHPRTKPEARRRLDPEAAQDRRGHIHLRDSETRMAQAPGLVLGNERARVPLLDHHHGGRACSWRAPPPDSQATEHETIILQGACPRVQCENVLPISTKKTCPDRIQQESKDPVQLLAGVCRRRRQTDLRAGGPACQFASPVGNRSRPGSTATAAVDGNGGRWTATVDGRRRCSGADSPQSVGQRSFPPFPPRRLSPLP